MGTTMTKTGSQVKREQDVRNRSICLCTMFHMWGTERTVYEDDADRTERVEKARVAKKNGEKPEAAKADLDAVKVAKRLLQDPRYNKLGNVNGRMKRWLVQTCVPLPLRQGYYLVPLEMIAMVEDRFREYEREFADALNEFIEALPEIKADSMARLSNFRIQGVDDQGNPIVKYANLWDENQWPSAERIRAACYYETSYVSFEIPDQLKQFDTALYRTEQKKAERAWAQATEEIRFALRGSLLELISKMADQLAAPGTDGRGRTYNSATLDKLNNFLDTFAKRNLTNDDELARLVSKAKEVASGLDREAIKASSETRSAVTKAFKDVQSALGRLVVDKPRRRFSFND